jgi:hypothetical protein
MPVTDNRERQQQKRDQQQPCSFRGIDRMPMVLMIRMIVMIEMVRLKGRHANIVALLVWGWALFKPALSEVEGSTERSSAAFGSHLTVPALRSTAQC